MKTQHRAAIVGLFTALLVLPACGDDTPSKKQSASPGADARVESDADAGTNRDAWFSQREQGIHDFANGCYAVGAAAPESGPVEFLTSTDDGSYAFSASGADSGSKFFMKASDIATYLLHDAEERYVVVKNGNFKRQETLESDLTKLDDSFLPGAQWKVEVSTRNDQAFQLKHERSGKYLTKNGLADSADGAALITFESTSGCTEHPELGVHAEGEVKARKFDDGSVWGIAETHTHLMSNFSFGGAGMFHGSPFHPLGVEHALPSCKQFHGEDGRKDLFGFGFDNLGEVNQNELIGALLAGKTPKFNHHTAGYPEFTDWPDAHDSSTHQTQYYKWIKRAYKGGLRLMVQLATSNQIICQLLKGEGIQPTRYSCNDMVAVDRIIKETKRMERYIDAQNGGPGEGWFQIVESPDEAREVINNGKMAVILGIETSNLFDCFLSPPEGEERCDKQDVVEALDKYEEKGVQNIFPVHKYDNAFSAGDGHRGIIELGNFIQTGHWSSFVKNCPDVPAAFDQGDVQFGGLNKPRDDYDAEPAEDMSNFSEEPVGTLSGYLEQLRAGSLEGDYCHKHGLTELGRFLIHELMDRGMLVEVDHLPQRSYKEVFEILEKHDYPAVGSHGTNYNGKIYELGGVSKFNFDTCADPDDPGSRLEPLEERLDLIEEAGAYPGEGFGFDLNGFAGAPGPRFGEDSECEKPQENRITYPFESYAGNVTFTEPKLGNRTVDFDTEGFVHIGMIPELIQDVRNTGATKEDLEPLFRSAEAYLRMWEKAERRSEEISNDL